MYINNIYNVYIYTGNIIIVVAPTTQKLRHEISSKPFLKCTFQLSGCFETNSDIFFEPQSDGGYSKQSSC